MNETGQLRVAVLMGGPDEEHDVSLASGEAVARALHTCSGIEVVEQIVERPDAQTLAALNVDVIFPVLHGPWGEGGGIQQELEKAGCRFVGSNSNSAATAMNKTRTKEIAAEVSIPTPAWQVLHPGSDRALAAPAVLKPPAQGSSIDLFICHDETELNRRREELNSKYESLLVESYISGREITVSVIADKPLPLIEIIPADGFYDYDAKYHRDDTKYVVNPDLPDFIEDACRLYATKLGRVLGCRDLYRVDFMVDEHIPWMLEVNTMPGFTDHSLLPMAAQAIGQSMADLCEQLVRLAAARTEDVATSP